MKNKDEGFRKIDEIKEFRETFLRCGRCGSMNTLHSSKLGVMRCRQCGFEWDATEMEREV